MEHDDSSDNDNVHDDIDTTTTTTATVTKRRKITADGTGLRYNQKKLRFDLVPTHAQEQFVNVLSMGAQKYGDENWRKGISWRAVGASLERHLHAWKKGEDVDRESGLSHMAHIMCNAAFLLEYEQIYKEGDDRIH